MTGIDSLNNLVSYDSYVDSNGKIPPYFAMSAWNSVTNPNDASSASMSVIVGSGDAKPTSKDTQLSSIISDLTYVTSSMNQGTDDYVKIISITYKNNTSQTITIKELGLIVQSSSHAWGSVYEYQRALLGRVVLGTPVVMNPGDTYTFTYAIE